MPIFPSPPPASVRGFLSDSEQVGIELHESVEQRRLPPLAVARPRRILAAALDQSEPTQRPQKPQHEQHRRHPVRIAQHGLVRQHAETHQAFGILPPVPGRRERPQRQADLRLGPVATLGLAEQAEAHLPEAVPEEVPLDTFPRALEHMAPGSPDPEPACFSDQQAVHRHQLPEQPQFLDVTFPQPLAGAPFLLEKAARPVHCLAHGRYGFPQERSAW